MEKKEFIEMQTKKAEAYKAALERMEKEIETMLDGKPEKYEKENGMPGFHEKFNEIKHVRYEMSKIQIRLNQCKQSIVDAE